MSDLDPIGQRLLERARRGHDPDAADEERVRAGLHARLAAAPLLLTAKSAHALATGGKLTLGKLLLAIGVCGGASVAVGAAVWHAARPSAFTAQAMQAAVNARPAANTRHALLSGPNADGANAQSPNAHADSPSANAASPNSASANPLAAAEDQAHAPLAMSGTVGAEAPSSDALGAAKRGASATPKAGCSGPCSVTINHQTPNAAPGAALSTEDLQLEIAGLRRAQQLLHAGHAAQALAALDNVARQVPGGALTEERDATRAMALCALGHPESAAVAAFLAHYPNSVHVSGVQRACASP
jgi:hypothetical protein